MTDDTSYFIPFATYNMAYVCMLILNSARVRHFLSSIAFVDAKRPFTKKVLEQIDFGKILSELRFSDLIDTEKELKLDRYLNINMFENFLHLPELVRSTPPQL